MPSQSNRGSPWPGPTKGATIITKLKAHASDFSAREFAGRTVFIRESDGATISINESTMYSKRRVRKFMEKPNISPEVWHDLPKS